MSMIASLFGKQASEVSFEFWHRTSCSAVKCISTLHAPLIIGFLNLLWLSQASVLVALQVQCVKHFALVMINIKQNEVFLSDQMICWVLVFNLAQ